MAIPPEEFFPTRSWLDGFRERRGLETMKLHGESAQVNKNDPRLLRQLEELYDIIRNRDKDNIYNMDETALVLRAFPRSTLKLKCEVKKTTRGPKMIKDRVSLIVCANATGSHKIPCTMISKAAEPACIRGKKWPIPYLVQRNACMDRPNCWQWFNRVFFPAVRKRTSKLVLHLIDNAPGHFTAFERGTVKVALFPPNCTSWKQPCDLGIIDALKNVEKHSYLADFAANFKIRLEARAQMHAVASNLRTCTAGVDHGRPANLLNAAGYIEDAWESIKPESIANCFRKADLFRSNEQVSTTENGVDAVNFEDLIRELEHLNIRIEHDDMEE